MTNRTAAVALAATLALCPLAGRAADFTISSEAFASGTVQPAQFADIMGCTGANVSPDIHWSNAPAGTKSFVVTVYDKDAPTGSGWWHWVVVDLPADATGLAAGAASPDNCKASRVLTRACLCLHQADPARTEAMTLSVSAAQTNFGVLLIEPPELS